VKSSHPNENSDANIQACMLAAANEDARRASSTELLARMIHLSEQECCQDSLFIGFEDELVSLFLLPGVDVCMHAHVCSALGQAVSG
jgi:hypothetical protein